MKKTGFLLFLTFILLVLYNVWLLIFPLQKHVFYTNEERIQEYIYDRVDYNTVLIGSSLSGVFERNDVFKEKNFMLYMAFTGSNTGLDVLRRTNKIPKKLFIEINHIDRGIDSALLAGIFSQPSYRLRYFLPFLQTKNKVLPNLIDRMKNPVNNKVNESKPDEKLFDQLLKKEQKEWGRIKDTVQLNNQLEYVKYLVAEFASAGVRIYFFEMPMDSSLTNSPVLKYQRQYFIDLATEKKYYFIPTDTSRAYQTGDGVHLLRKDADIYLDYFKNELIKRN